MKRQSIKLIGGTALSVTLASSVMAGCGKSEEASTARAASGGDTAKGSAAPNSAPL